MLLKICFTGINSLQTDIMMHEMKFYFKNFTGNQTKYFLQIIFLNGVVLY